MRASASYKLTPFWQEYFPDLISHRGTSFLVMVLVYPMGCTSRSIIKMHNCNTKYNKAGIYLVNSPTIVDERYYMRLPFQKLVQAWSLWLLCGGKFTEQPSLFISSHISIWTSRHLFVISPQAKHTVAKQKWLTAVREVQRYWTALR